MKRYTTLLIFGGFFLYSSLLFSMEEGIKKRKHEDIEEIAPLDQSKQKSEPKDKIILKAELISHAADKEEPRCITMNYGELDIYTLDALTVCTFAELLQEAKSEHIPLHIVLLATFDSGKQHIRAYELYSYFQSQLGEDFFNILCNNVEFYSRQLIDPVNKQKPISLVLFKIDPISNEATFLGHVPPIMYEDTPWPRAIITSIKQSIPKTWKKAITISIKNILQKYSEEEFKDLMEQPSSFDKDIWQSIMDSFQNVFSGDIILESDEDAKTLMNIVLSTISLAFISPHVEIKDLEILYNTWKRYEQLTGFGFEWNTFLKKLALLASLHQCKDYAVQCAKAYNPESNLDKEFIKAKVAFYLGYYESCMKCLEAFNNNTDHKDYAYVQFLRNFIEALSTSEKYKAFLYQFRDHLQLINDILSQSEDAAEQEILKYIFIVNKLIQDSIGSTNEQHVKSRKTSLEKLQLLAAMKTILKHVDEHYYFVARCALIIEKNDHQESTTN